MENEKDPFAEYDKYWDELDQIETKSNKKQEQEYHFDDFSDKKDENDYRFKIKPMSILSLVIGIAVIFNFIPMAYMFVPQAIFFFIFVGVILRAFKKK